MLFSMPFLGMVNEQLQAQLEPYAAYGITFSGLTADGYGRGAGPDGGCVHTDGSLAGGGAAVRREGTSWTQVAQFRDGVKAYTTRCRGGRHAAYQQLFWWTERPLYRQ